MLGHWKYPCYRCSNCLYLDLGLSLIDDLLPTGRRGAGGGGGEAVVPSAVSGVCGSATRRAGSAGCYAGKLSGPDGPREKYAALA